MLVFFANTKRGRSKVYGLKHSFLIACLYCRVLICTTSISIFHLSSLIVNRHPRFSAALDPNDFAMAGPDYGALGATFKATRFMQAASMIAIIGMTSNFISEMITAELAPPSLLTGILSIV